MTPDIETRRFILCPRCKNYKFEVEHLMEEEGRSFGPWKCRNYSKICNTEIMGKIENGKVNVEVRDGVLPGLALLKFRDIYLVVDELFLTNGDHSDFFYHSHQCPTNILNHVEEVFDSEGKDPHGLIRFVANIEKTDDNMLNNINSLEELFELFKTNGELPPTDWPEENKGVIPYIAELRRKKNLY